MTESTPTQRRYPLGIQTFAEIASGGYVYVDKTQGIHRLTTESKYVFFSRPRRFGKSLLVSTLKSLFEGRRDLFSGLWIENAERDWTPAPVVHLDFSLFSLQKPEWFLEEVKFILNKCAKKHGISLDSSTEKKGESLSNTFMSLLEELHEKTGQRVVVLIDEYDRPVLNFFENKDDKRAETYRDLLRDFYSVLKGQDGHLRFVFITGITRFSKMSIFSAMNQLRDISMSDAYSELAGYTEAELGKVFAEDVARLAGYSEKIPETRERIRRWYNGYRFSKRGESVYNPYSILSLFIEGEFAAHWYNTGTPKFLVSLLKQKNYPLAELGNVRIPEILVKNFELREPDLDSLLFQAGYLTLKSYDSQSGTHTLGFPNQEVEKAFTEGLAIELFGTEAYKDLSVSRTENLLTALRDNDVDRFMEGIGNFLAGIPYLVQAEREVSYSSAIYVLFKLMGFSAQVEVPTSDGRMDMAVRTENRVFVFEFKLDKSPVEAMKQLRDKAYHLRFTGEEGICEAVLVGVGFDRETRRPSGWLTETVEMPSRNESEKI